MTSYTVEKHFRGTSALVTDLARSIQAFVLGLDSVIKEVPGKNYIAYKLSKIIIYMTVQKKRVRLCLNLDPEELLDAPKELNPRVVANWGRAALVLFIESQGDLELAKPLLIQAYQKIRG